MGDFLLVKRFELGFLGEKWKDAYLEFNAFTVKDVRDKLPKLTKIDETKSKSVSGGMQVMLELLEEKFIDGKAVDKDGNTVKVKAGDLVDLPIEIISKAVGFLSGGLGGGNQKP